MQAPRLRVVVAVAMLVTLTLMSCARQTNPTGTAASKAAIVIELSKPIGSVAVTSGTVTITSALAPDLPGVVSPLTIDGNNFEGRIEGILPGPIIVAVALFDERGALVYSGKNQAFVLPGEVNEVPIELAEPVQTIDDAVVHMHFDHQRGCIDSLVFKLGSGHDIIAQEANDRQSQYGLGGVIAGENGTYLKRFALGANMAEVEYTNPGVYDSKLYRLLWSAVGGLEVTIEIDVTSPRPVTIGSSWQPGGDNDLASDSLGIWTTGGAIEAFELTYPASGSGQVFSGQTFGAAWWDKETYGLLLRRELFGYRWKSGQQTYCNQSNTADGPYLTLASGSHKIEFALKDELSFLVWSVGQNPE